MRGGKGDLFGKRSPFPPDPPTLPKTFIQAGMAGPRLADTGHGIVRCRRARLWGQGGILAAVRPGRNGRVCGRKYGRDAGAALPAGRSMNFPLKKQESLCPRRDTGRESAFGEGWGEFEGGREPPLCASQRGSLPPSTKSLLQSLTRYRGAQAGRLATRSASAGRKGRSRAWAGVTQRSS